MSAALEPGAVASEVARQAGIHTSQLFRWRRELCGPPQTAAAFAAVAVTAEPVSTPALPVTPGVIDIEFAAGGRMRITGMVDAATVSATIRALVTPGRRR